jgi:outer membrane protein assembly factor BamB
MPSRLLVVPIFLLALSALAADWRQFRGPGGSGVSDEKGLPTTWSAKENIVWRTKLPGPGTSSPIVVGKRIYLTCYTGYGVDRKNIGRMADLERHLVCLDRGSGQILWTKEFEPSLPESKYDSDEGDYHGYASSTPASDGKHLYLFFGASGVYCLDLDGKKVWRAYVGKNVRPWGSATSPVLYKDLVIVNGSVESGELVAFKQATGDEVWRTKGISEAWNTPVLVNVPGGRTELVLNINSGTVAFNPEDGKELWRVDGGGGYVCCSVVAHKDIVYVLRQQGVTAIKAGGDGDVTKTNVLWRAKGNSVVSSPVYHDGKLYWFDSGGMLCCLDAETGKDVYRNRLSGYSGPNHFFASALIADGKIYGVARGSVGWGLKVVQKGPDIFVCALGSEFKELAHNRFEDDKSRTNATPIAHEGCLLMRTDQYLYCIGKK